MNGHSIDLVRRLGILSPTMKAKIIAAINMWSDIPMFLLIYHIPSAESSFVYKYMWSHLAHLPSFAIAIKLQSDAKPQEEHPQVRIQLPMSDQHELDQVLENPVPLELSGSMYVFVPFESVKREEEQDAEPSPVEEEESMPLDKLNKNMMEMFSHCCNAKELGSYRKFWYFLRSIPPGTISINEAGTVLLYQGREISTLTFIKECTKGTPPPQHGHQGHYKRKKISPVTRLCIPFVSELLKHSSFPQHLITNQLLVRLARMHME